MDSFESEIHRILRDHGATLERKKKHQVYRFPNGQIFALCSTPSDKRYYQWALRDLKHRLGLHGARGAAGSRRERKPESNLPDPFRADNGRGEAKMTLQEQIQQLAEKNASLKEKSHPSGKKIVHPVHGSRKASSSVTTSAPVDLSGLLNKFAKS